MLVAGKVSDCPSCAVVPHSNVMVVSAPPQSTVPASVAWRLRMLLGAVVTATGATAGSTKGGRARKTRGGPAFRQAARTTPSPGTINADGKLLRLTQFTPSSER